MKGFTGKGWTTGAIAYAGFKDVLRRVTLVIRNTGRKAVRVRVEAVLHDTYHDNGQEQCERELAPGEQGLFILSAPPLKWTRRLSITSGTKNAELGLAGLACAVTPRSKLEPPKPPPFGNAEPKLLTDGLVLHLSGDTVKSFWRWREP